MLRRSACVAAMWVGAIACGAQTPVLMLPSGVAYDLGGNLYVADARLNRVFETTLSGVTVVVAGTGEQGFGGDGGLATAALLNGPQSVAVGADGTVYIADTGNQRVRAVVGGVITTVAGNGTKGFADGRFSVLNGPMALAVDAGGGLLIADSGNERVRRVLAGWVTTFAGTGVQGFGGDGGLAVGALLDGPSGVAVAGDGRVFVADSRNHRVRVIGVDGVIRTFAGTGVRGFGGDGGAAVGAMLWLPRGVAVRADGGVVFADSDNQRVRLVDVAGVISTVAGSGVQGAAVDGVVGVGAALDSPRGVAVSGFALTVFGDAHNRVVREVAGDAGLYVVGVPRVTSVVLSVPVGLVYGQGVVEVSVGGAAPAAMGTVALLDGGVPVSTGVLVGGGATLRADTLGAGTHTLTGVFAGDGVHGAAVSSAMVVGVAAVGVVAAADAATMVYGGVVPVLTGTVVGVLGRDVGSVGVGFSSSAVGLAGVGSYPVTGVLSGAASGNYVVTGTTGVLQVLPAGVAVSVSGSQVSYVGLPVTLSAVVGSATRGVPTGTVSFLESGVVVGTGTVVGGSGSAVWVGAGSGVHAVSATYGGDGNFLAGTSGVAAITVSAMPDFTVGVSGSSTQTVQGGAIAVYTLAVGAAPGPFSGSVNFSATGLPVGATATFSPVAVVPGSGSSVVTMSVQTKALAMRAVRPEVWFAGVMVMVFAMRRRRWPGLAMVLVLVCAGCGDRSFSASAGQGAQTFAVTVLGTSTNLAGVVVVHTTQVTLVVQ